MNSETIVPHPELLPGEVFIRNDGSAGFERVKAVLKTARQGQTALNIYGAPVSLSGFLPIFADAAELEAAGGSLLLEVRHMQLHEESSEPK